MKKKITDVLYREMAGSGACAMLDRVTTLLERRAKGQKLTKQEESVLVAAEQSLGDILDAHQEGYRPETPAISSGVPPLPFSSFAEGLAQLQTRIQARGNRPQLRTAADSGLYRPDQGAKGGGMSKANAARIAAIVRMAQDERAKLKKR